MSAGKHSPSPWTALDGVGRAEFVIDANGNEFAQRTDGKPADMILMAAAPELLEALKRCLRYGGLFPDLAEEVRAAIAKATGAAR